ncbi:hypothetical protein CEXT_647901 [Caerostris extrusa]|uniref:Uncharacterized protein n=1 Tax=Caerostris extrusa TaxID=172846 RepID=A0AAV4PZI6_CAEEX|nr:hypothetical protein CEXT_647901 [Caerostris extrusa]
MYKETAFAEKEKDSIQRDKFSSPVNHLESDMEQSAELAAGRVGLEPFLFQVQRIFQDLKTGAFEVLKFIRSLRGGKGPKETFSTAPIIRESFFHVTGQGASSSWFSETPDAKRTFGIKELVQGELLIKEESKDFRCTNT